METSGLHDSFSDPSWRGCQKELGSLGALATAMGKYLLHQSNPKRPHLKRFFRKPGNHKPQALRPKHRYLKLETNQLRCSIWAMPSPNPASCSLGLLWREHTLCRACWPQVGILPISWPLRRHVSAGVERVLSFCLGVADVHLPNGIFGIFAMRPCHFA